MDIMTDEKMCRTTYWYPLLANYTFFTVFVKLHENEIQALANGEQDSQEAKDVISRMTIPMHNITGNCFVFTDSSAPTDTERFEKKRGAVFSAKSAWRFLALSEKVRAAAKDGKVSSVCIRPFRRMSKPREFRLFIYDGKLTGMSQYWLIRHFRRLEGPKQEYWEKAAKMVDEISWLLPVKNVVMDIYFTSSGKIIIIDLNTWGEPTDPLLFRTWQRNWAEVAGIKLITPPTKICGDVNVSF